ncbi:alginate export family protein [Alteromonas sp. a30]|uniref:alginate export family protein n=1 Tax=Alteromonas sp. a30 TaxID=2730917 RepID=UPI002280D569|nr:alginate export family protein [Alteromonas sp. a30]MCY7294627.1 alginate export family protein [Alteromonas sp. a30]
MYTRKPALGFKKAILLGAACSFIHLPAASAVEFDAGGSVRLRGESKQDFNLDDSSQTYWLSQVRFNLNTKINKQHAFFVELQDSRIFGEDDDGIPFINEDARNQPFSDQLDLHQAYWTFSGEQFSVKLGRQKFNLGDQRLVASLEWVNTARVHDGVRFTYKMQDRTIDAFASTLVSVDPEHFNDQSTSNNRYFDSEFHGIFVTDNVIMPNHKTEYWWFYRGNDSGVFDDSIHTLGARIVGSKNRWSWDLQGAWQTGDFYDVTRGVLLDHDAGMVHISADYKLAGSTIGIGYNWASGDDDPNDNDHGTFDNLYPLNHAYYGYMDLFSLQNTHNLELVYTRPELAGSKAKLRVALQNFWLDDTNDAWYNAGLGANTARLNAALQNDADSYVGSEIDVTVSMPVAGIKFLAGYSHFFAGSYAEDTGNDANAHFLFLQAKKSF